MFFLAPKSKAILSQVSPCWEYNTHVCMHACCDWSRYSFPAADPELLRGYYPLLTAVILEVQMRDEDEGEDLWHVLYFKDA